VISRGTFALGDVTLFFAAVVGIQEAFIGALSMLALSGRALALFGTYRAILALPEGEAGGALPGPLRREIRFEDVWFRYHPEGPWVLRGVDLVIPAGACIGLVGVNGAGKTTLIKLLCRFYEPDRGRILWDGVDLATVSRPELYARLAATFQDFMEYELSAAENIGLGDASRGFDRDKIREAARRVELDDVLSALPRGYDTLLTKRLADLEPGGASRGAVLSGGEWQRLAVARCLIRRDADVLILDEPSAGLDAEAEHRLHQVLEHHARDKTRVLISHRLGALRGADRIVVLADGVIAESGSHDALMAAGREYARLFSLQAAGYRDPPAASHGDRP
jgi:ATP-binding cassette subfamily B protein